MPAADTFRFVKAFLKSPAAVGAIAPSSPRLAKAMLEGIKLTAADAIVEFGPGTGPFTKAIHEQLPDHRQYLGIERDAKFVGLLNNRFEDLRFVEGSAEDARQHVEAAGLGRIRVIICGLPFASLPPKVQDGVVDAIDALMQSGCEFRTFQYVHAYGLPTAIRYRRRMSERFGKCRKIGPVYRNVPPAYVLKWSR